VERFIHFSSTVIYGFAGNRLTGEDRLSSPFRNPYCLTKVIAEREILKYRDRLRLIILRPSNVFGPGDLTTTYPLFEALRKGMPCFPAGGRYLTSPCYIDNWSRQPSRLSGLNAYPGRHSISPMETISPGASSWPG